MKAASISSKSSTKPPVDVNTHHKNITLGNNSMSCSVYEHKHAASHTETGIYSGLQTRSACVFIEITAGETIKWT